MVNVHELLHIPASPVDGACKRSLFSLIKSEKINMSCKRERDWVHVSGAIHIRYVG